MAKKTYVFGPGWSRGPLGLGLFFFSLIANTRTYIQWAHSGFITKGPSLFKFADDVSNFVTKGLTLLTFAYNVSKLRYKRSLIV